MIEQDSYSNLELYDSEGYVHWVCPNGHYYKNQEFSAVENTCNTCGEVTDRRSYQTHIDEAIYSSDTMYSDDNHNLDYEDYGNHLLES